MTDIDLQKNKCKPCEGGVSPLTEAEALRLLKQLNGWQLHTQHIIKAFDFKNFDQTMAFVNAVAWISQKEDHHPELKVSYSQCQISYQTHAIVGLSENDFICAAKIDALFDL